MKYISQKYIWKYRCQNNDDVIDVFLMLFNNSIYRLPWYHNQYTQDSVMCSIGKYDEICFTSLQNLNFLCNSSCCLFETISFFQMWPQLQLSHSIFTFAPSHAADVSRPLSSYCRCITASLWEKQEGMQTTSEHGRLQEWADSLSSDWAHVCGFCCHVLVTFDE